MPCYDPIFAYQPLRVNEVGKRPIKFASDIGMKDIPGAFKLQIPCGRCIGCRLERSRQWALRCVHEASLYEENCFITLTFSPEYIKNWYARNLKLEDIPRVHCGSLIKRDFQLFLKRLRRRFPLSKIRYFHCGEYGDDNDRPHHHACLFNFRFPDLKPFITPSGSKVLVSDILNELWPYGYSYVGEVTFESAAYVARYVLKKWAREKLHGKELYDAMTLFDRDDGDKIAEYITMSRRPGIGADWIQKFESDVYPKDFITVRGVRCKPPKYYDLKKALTDDLEMLRIKYVRAMTAKNSPDNSLVRLKERRKVKELNASQLRRKYETNSV